jgi:hypothetical protein
MISPPILRRIETHVSPALPIIIEAPTKNVASKVDTNVYNTSGNYHVV